jgi:hypothetical protein
MDDKELLLNGEYVVLAIDNSIDDVSDNQVTLLSVYIRRNVGSV